MFSHLCKSDILAPPGE